LSGARSPGGDVDDPVGGGDSGPRTAGEPESDPPRGAGPPVGGDSETRTAAGAGSGPGPSVALPAWLTERYAAWMREALTEAALAPAGGDVPIGAVVVAEDGEVIGRGHNVREAEGDPVGHAEVLALREAGRVRGSWRLSGCSLVVTLEPCAMCAGASVLARVDRIVYAAADPKAGAVGSLWDLPRDQRLNHRPEVVSGILADEAGALLENFFASRRPIG